MDTSNNNKEITVILPEPETDEQKKRRRKRIIALFVMSIVAVADLSGILAYFATKNNKKEDTYQVSEESISIYNNLLTFIKDACGTDHSQPSEIVAVDYRDDKLLVSSKNKTNEIYVEYEYVGGIDGALSQFKTGTPTLEGYSIESAFTISDEKQLNIISYAENKTYVGIVSKSLTNQYYLSSTYSCTCGSLI